MDGKHREFLAVGDCRSSSKGASDLVAHLEVAENAELEQPIVKESLHLARHVSEINWRSDNNRISRQKILRCHFAHPPENHVATWNALGAINNSLGHFLG